jgi:hypothetical protein
VRGAIRCEKTNNAWMALPRFLESQWALHRESWTFVSARLQHVFLS